MLDCILALKIHASENNNNNNNDAIIWSRDNLKIDAI